MRIPRLPTVAAAAAALLALSATAGHAATVTIDFDAFSLGSFSAGTEDGFDITATSGAIIPGSAIPNFSAPYYLALAAGSNSVEFTKTGGGTFTFDQLLHAGGGAPGAMTDFHAEGFLGGVSQFDVTVSSTAGSFGDPAAIFSAGSNSLLNIDRFVLSLTNPDRGIGFDDIVFGDAVPTNSVPLPAAAWLLLGGLGALGLVARRRAA